MSGEALVAAVPELRDRWALDPGRVGWLTGAVQLGFVVGTAAAALLNLADIWPSRTYFARAAVLGALANLALLAAPDYTAALATRAAIMATWLLSSASAMGALMFSNRLASVTTSAVSSPSVSRMSSDTCST